MIGEWIRWIIFLFIYFYSATIQAQIIEKWNWKEVCKKQALNDFMSDGLCKKTFTQHQEYWEQKANNKQEEKGHHRGLIRISILLWLMIIGLFFVLGIYKSEGWWVALIILSLSLIKAVYDFSKEIEHYGDNKGGDKNE